jgi:hypothetical protein
MKINELKDRIAEIVTQITFTYNGKSCGVDPMSSTEFDMWYGDDFVTVGSIEEVMNTKLFDNKSLTDIFDDIDDLEM